MLGFFFTPAAAHDQLHRLCYLKRRLKRDGEAQGGFDRDMDLLLWQAQMCMRRSGFANNGVLERTHVAGFVDIVGLCLSGRPTS